MKVNHSLNIHFEIDFIISWINLGGLWKITDIDENNSIYFLESKNKIVTLKNHDNQIIFHGKIENLDQKYLCGILTKI